MEKLSTLVSIAAATAALNIGGAGCTIHFGSIPERPASRVRSAEPVPEPIEDQITEAQVQEEIDDNIAELRVQLDGFLNGPCEEKYNFCKLNISGFRPVQQIGWQTIDDPTVVIDSCRGFFWECVWKNASNSSVDMR